MSKKDDSTITDLVQDVATERQLAACYNAERDLANQLLAKMQLADAFTQFSGTVRTSVLANVKEIKAYKALRGQKSPDGTEFSGTWEEYCTRFVGRSVDQVDEDIRNLRIFGEAALDSMQNSMGIGYRQLRDFRQLPDDEKSALVKVAETGDKDSFIELAETLIAKHQKETKKLTKERDDAKQDAEAKDAVLADKAAKIAQLETAKKKLKALPPDEESEALRNEGHLVGYQVEALIRGQLRPALQQIIDHAREHGVVVEEWVRGELNQIDTALLELRSEIGVERQLDTLVPWESQA